MISLKPLYLSDNAVAAKKNCVIKNPSIFADESAKIHIGGSRQ
jgi:hypothetical protein